ncbi:MAG: LPD38 domain-containing protein, partial [Opitutales bacterium]
KLGRMLKDPKTWGMGAAMITAPSIALWNVNKDNPEYWDTYVWERNMFWLIPKNGEPDEYGKVGFWRIPKPFEIGLLFASLPERLLDAAAQSGVDMPVLETGKTEAPRVAEPGRAISQTLGAVGKEAAVGILPIPTAVSVPGQLLLNRDIFRGRPIVSRTDLPESEQITPESSALARVLADRGIAPQKTDFAVRGLLGGVGSLASEAVDVAARKAGGAAPEPRAPRTGVARVIPGRFQTRTYSATDAEVAARDRLRDLREVNNGLRKVELSNDQARIDRYIQRNDADLKAWFSLSGAQSQLDDLAAERRAIIADTRKSQEERRRVLAEIRTEADRIARDVLAFGMRR